jgi:hypothetical protein
MALRGGDHQATRAASSAKASMTAHGTSTSVASISAVQSSQK